MKSRPYLLEVQSGGNSADLVGISSFLGFILYFYFVARMLFPMLSQITWFKPDEQPVVSVHVDTVPTQYQPNYTGVQPAEVFSTATLQPTMTAYPTYTPYPTHTPSVGWLQITATVTQNSFNPQDVNWVFSYYYPDLVAEDEVLYGANCHPDNIERNPQGKAIRCKNTSASGLGWRDWLMYSAVDTQYRGGVAVPYYPNTYNPIYPMGATLVINSPPSIAGYYLVMDICPACDDYVLSHNVLFLDFLAKGLPEGVTFWDEVGVQDVVYP
jgi:hypothetical protein